MTSHVDDHVTDNNTAVATVNMSTMSPFYLSDKRFLIPINGYVVPIFVLITLATNCMICAVLLRAHMRSPTNVVLVAMATSDMLTGVWSLPFSIWLYQFNGHENWMPYSCCQVYFYFTDHIPTIFHTSSIWLTVLLAVQRYIYICHPIAAKRLCTLTGSVRAAIAIFIAALVSQITRFIDTTYHPVDVPSKINDSQVRFLNFNFIIIFF